MVLNRGSSSALSKFSYLNKIWRGWIDKPSEQWRGAFQVEETAKPGRPKGDRARCSEEQPADQYCWHGEQQKTGSGSMELDHVNCFMPSYELCFCWEGVAKRWPACMIGQACERWEKSGLSIRFLSWATGEVGLASNGREEAYLTLKQDVFYQGTEQMFSFEHAALDTSVR